MYIVVFGEPRNSAWMSHEDLQTLNGSYIEMKNQTLHGMAGKTTTVVSLQSVTHHFCFYLATSLRHPDEWPEAIVHHNPYHLAGFVLAHKSMEGYR